MKEALEKAGKGERRVVSEAIRQVDTTEGPAKFFPGGRVKFLEDTRGTGKYDKATVFLDGLPFPTGVLTWGKGVLRSIYPKQPNGDFGYTELLYRF